MGSLTIDGRAVTPSPGEDLLACVRRHGARVPSLCRDQRLDPIGACRACVVKVDGRVVASCTRKAADGGAVVTDDPELRTLRRSVVELAASLLPDGPCPRCAIDAAVPANEGRCEFHRQAALVEARAGRFAGAQSGVRRSDDANPLLARDYTRCINCYRCVAVCDQLEADTALGVSGRGFFARITAGTDTGLADSTCEFCGLCINTCPTGALSDKKRDARVPADLRPEEIERVDSVCAYCGTGCGVTLETARGQLLGVHPRFDHPMSNGTLCVKGQFGLDFIGHPDRLTTPLLREGNGFRRATWDEALDFIAERLRPLRGRPEAFAAWPSSRTTTESNYLLQKFARAVMGTNNVDNCQRT
jgi:predicted molibdopterin-dependent oxidoreductase YjgC